MSDVLEVCVHNGWKVAVRPGKTNLQTHEREEGRHLFPTAYDVGILSFDVTRGITYTVKISPPNETWEYYVYCMNDADTIVSQNYVKRQDTVFTGKVISGEHRVALQIAQCTWRELFR
eukprot:2268739-Rhodomonas_salina.1